MHNHHMLKYFYRFQSILLLVSLSIGWTMPVHAAVQASPDAPAPLMAIIAVNSLADTDTCNATTCTLRGAINKANS